MGILDSSEFDYSEWWSGICAELEAVLRTLKLGYQFLRVLLAWLASADAVSVFDD